MKNGIVFSLFITSLFFSQVLKSDIPQRFNGQYLYTAAKKGDLEAVKEFVCHEVQMGERTAMYDENQLISFDSAVYILVRENVDTDLLKKTLELRENLSGKDTENFLSKLLMTATAGDVLRPINRETINLLINVGADVNYHPRVYASSDNWGEEPDRIEWSSTPLHNLALFNSSKKRHKDWASDQAIQEVIQNKIDIINILVKRGANRRAINHEKKYPFQVAIEPSIRQALRWKV